MRTKIIIAGGLVVAFLAGGILGGYIKPGASRPYTEANLLNTDLRTPFVFSCDDGRLVVTPVVQDGRTQLQIECVRNDMLAAGPRMIQVVDRRSEPVVERVVERRVVESRGSRTNRRPWEREVLIVAGSAGAGAGIGAVAGGKKGAAIGALSGGIAGLVYDLATRR